MNQPQFKPTDLTLEQLEEIRFGNYLQKVLGNVTEDLTKTISGVAIRAIGQIASAASLEVGGVGIKYIVAAPKKFEDGSSHVLLSQYQYTPNAELVLFIINAEKGEYTLVNSFTPDFNMLPNTQFKDYTAEVKNEYLRQVVALDQHLKSQGSEGLNGFLILQGMHFQGEVAGLTYFVEPESTATIATEAAQTTTDVVGIVSESVPALAFPEITETASVVPEQA